MEKNGLPESRAGKVIATILFVLIVTTFSYMFFFSGGSTSQTQTTYAPDEIELHIQAQEFVRQSLKAPSTAKFPTLPYEARSLGDGMYRVVSYVDSQNSFGATLRSDWSVNMILVEKLWFLDRMVIDGKVVYDASTSK